MSDDSPAKKLLTLLQLQEQFNAFKSTAYDSITCANLSDSPMEEWNKLLNLTSQQLFVSIKAHMLAFSGQVLTETKKKK